MQIPEVISSRFRFAGDLARAADVARVLAKYGLATWLADVEWEPVQNAMKTERGESLAGQAFEARVRLALTDLGTTFIKLGQMLSTRPDLTGAALSVELQKLQQNTPPDPPDAVIRMVERELGRPVGECFRRFDGVALASASIGQVHRARLTSGRRAIVKVQHPGIEGTIRRDLDILRFLAEIAEKNDALRRYEPVSFVREFSRSMLNELDFRREARNLQSFRRNFAEDTTVTFPKPFPDLASGRVLTMEYLRGCSLADARQLEKLNVDRAELARRGANVFIEMIFRDGFYHADPHPGNILVLPNGKIGLIDAGMVGRIDEQFRRQVEDILMAAGDRDGERLMDAVTRVCGVPRDLDRVALSADLTEFFQEFGTQAVGQFNVGGALSGVTNILHEHKLILPSSLSMLIKCLIMLEGTGRGLSPDFSLAELLAPWRKKIIWRRFSPEARLKGIRKLYTDWERIAEAVPKVLGDLLEQLKVGRFSLRLEQKNLKQATNRLIVGLFTSSLLISSALLMGHVARPSLFGISIPGVLGYAVALIIGLRMMWMNRDKNWDD